MSDIKRFWWVRHAPTHAKTMVGWTDISADLSDKARLHRVAAALPESAPVITSTLSRAIETGRAIAGKRPILPPKPDLREIHFGEWENVSFDAANQRDPEKLRAFWESSGDDPAPKGESWNDLRSRVDRTADMLLDHAHPDLIIVAHFGSILCQLQRALAVDTQTIFAQKIDNLSITCLEFSGQWSAKNFNKIV